MAVGSSFFEEEIALEGTVQLFYGSPAGPSDEADTTVRGEGTGWGFGSAVAGVGDVNADGSRDFVVGAPYASAQAYEAGMAYLYLGPFTRE